MDESVEKGIGDEWMRWRSENGMGNEWMEGSVEKGMGDEWIGIKGKKRPMSGWESGQGIWRLVVGSVEKRKGDKWMAV